MRKIDEVKMELQALWDTIVYVGTKYTAIYVIETSDLKLLESALKKLEQLRPYIELAEEIIIHSGEITNWESYLERGKNISLLIQQIKEQEK